MRNDNLHIPYFYAIAFDWCYTCKTLSNFKFPLSLNFIITTESLVIYLPKICFDNSFKIRFALHASTVSLPSWVRNHLPQCAWGLLGRLPIKYLVLSNGLWFSGIEFEQFVVDSLSIKGQISQYHPPKFNTNKGKN